MVLENNVFPFLNLAELETQYRLYEIRGLRRHSEYYQNRQNLIHRLSYLLKHPVTIIERNEKPFLAVSADAPDLAASYPIIRGVVYFKLTGDTLTLDYSLRTPQNDEICLRFLHFMVQSALFGNVQLWQPSAGKPFFEKIPYQEFGSISLFRGFSVRPVFTESGSIGLCVDVQHKFISCNPLPTYLTEQAFQSYKAKHCIYHYGHQWYEIQLSELSDLNVMEAIVPDGNNRIPLLEFIVKNSQKPIPEDLASVHQDAAVVHYFNNQNADRMAIASLCHLVYDNTNPIIKKHHHYTILAPNIRHSVIHQLVKKYLTEIRFGNTNLKVADIPEQVSQEVFTIPDYRFGNNYRLSVRGSKGATQVALAQVGRQRLTLLNSKDAGVYVQEPFDRQYLLLPQTVGDSFGSKFVHDLKKAVDQLYPAGGGYQPQVIYYSDRGFRTYIEQGRAILNIVKEHQILPGYGVVMLPHTLSHLPRQHDPLAALVVRESKNYDLYVAIIHSATGQECYELRYNDHGQPFYAARVQKRSKLQGYLRAVALNKVLLTNERWPFVLDTPLYADIIIGIDVKHHTAGYIVVNKDGSRIWTLPPITSKQKEQLSSDQVKACLIEILTKEAEQTTYPLVYIVIHRDGRMYECEIEGVKQALATLKAQGILPENATLTILEISKSAPASLRLFDVQGSQSPLVLNPQVGYYHIVNDIDGYLCSTGRPFLKQGTVKPLHIRYIEGSLPFKLCLEDVYYLTALTWTKPDDCTRYSITVKLNDRRLSEDASEYDEDALRFGLPENTESEDIFNETIDSMQDSEETTV